MVMSALKQVILSFPDVSVMADYILKQKVSQIQTDSKTVTLSGILSDEDIAKACTTYGGDIIKMAGDIHEE